MSGFGGPQGGPAETRADLAMDPVLVDHKAVLNQACRVTNDRVLAVSKAVPNPVCKVVLAMVPVLVDHKGVLNQAWRADLAMTKFWWTTRRS